MIKASELRIGNKVKYGVVSVTIQGIHTQTIADGDTGKRAQHVYVSDFIKVSNYYCLTMDQLDPIPLNEEWLTKLGFEKDGSNYTHTLKTDGFEIDFSYDDDEKFYFYRTAHHTIKSIHQLQNLYFVLTGKELQIKE